MLRLSPIFKNCNETGSLNEQINLYGFIGSNVFLTKSGEVGIILEVRGVDYECLDNVSIDGFTKRLESALKLFDENYRVYQYLFKRNNETIASTLSLRPSTTADATCPKKYEPDSRSMPTRKTPPAFAASWTSGN